ncbi:SpoIIE family protein phosphatase [Actinoallomurus rhizosphaericola]|uniref:SpoIIE family protein phosphatase n=1 Tax=Actinoallomurus rhizosphaericola TaxID=2952536 RepID=UPI0020934BF7|nr:SpoIIE family protein phosphatase [Actinoallomurus rhizosphaericola]MCO5997088.1 SpoIIE family protein phosphatase [Actinoallomurus rhizosphaericola]
MGLPHTTGDRPSDEQADTSEATIERLRAELEQLRDKLRNTAAIERAKGALAERLGCGVDAAYTHLLQLARDSGITPLDAASLLFTPETRDDDTPPAPRSPADDAGDGDHGDGGDGDAGRPASPAAGRRPSAAVAADGPPPDAGVCPRPVFDDLVEQFEHAQRLGNLGCGMWEPATGASHWSDQVYAIFGRDPAEGPLPLDRLAAVVVPEDVPLTAHLISTLVDGREPVDSEIHIRRDGETRELRLIGEPVVDRAGRPVAVRCVYQDVTGWRRGERALTASRRQLEQLRVDEERRQAIDMQRSILPLPERVVDKPGLRAAIRYLPAGILSRVGGDWYETSAIDGEGVFLAIGDVSGHGRTAAAAMARLRNGLSGLAFTGAPPDRLLAWLNRLTLHWPTSLTATALAGRFDPETRTLTWAQGGHFPPLLIRDGKATTLDPPEGMLLGAIDDAEFGVATTSLEPGDLLLLYTDGLIERRDRDLQVGLDLLLRVAETAASNDPETVLDRVLSAFGAPNPNDDTCVVAIQIV